MMEGLAFQADKALLDAAFDGVVVIDLKTFGVSLANQAAANILGFDSPDDMVGAESLKCIPGEEREGIRRLLADVRSGACLPDGRELRIRDKRGKEMWILARGVKLGSNGVSLLLASFRDITAQKLADMALREAERRQLAMLDTSGESILISQDWRIVFANRGLLEAIGVSWETLVGLSILDIVHPEDRQALAERYRRVMNGEFIPFDEAYRSTGRDGQLAWRSLIEVPFTWKGKPAILTLIRDTSEQRTTEEAIKAGEQRYRSLLENANEAVLIVQDWKVVYVNRKFEEGIGIPRQALAGLNILDLTHPDDRQAVSERYQGIVKGEKYSSGAPMRGLNRDGETRWGDVREIPFMWEGRPAVLSMIVDITEQKLAEEALLESEKRYRLVTDNASDVIWTTDMSFNVTYMSPSAARLLRCSMAEAMTLTIQDMLTPESLEAGMKAFEQQMVLEGKEEAGLQREWSLEVEMRRRDGTTVWVEESVNLVRDSDGRPSGLIGITREISERKEAEGRQKLAADILGILNETRALPDAVNRILAIITRETGFDAAGIRLRNGDDFPYLVHSGFSEDFVKAENTLGMHGPDGNLCRDERGNVRLECTCGLVLSGKADPSNPLFTPGGSAWTNDSVSLLDVRPGEDPRLHPRNRCIHAGFQSVALIPIRRGTEIVGLLQLNDRRKGRFTPDTIRFFEGVAASIGVALVRKQAEEALGESEEKFRALVENSAAVVFSVDAEGKVSYISPGIERISGFKADELIGKSSLDYVVPEDLPGLIASMQRTVSGQLEPHEFRVKDSNGAVHHVLTSSRPVLRDGEAPKLIGVMVDTTEKKAAELALRNSETRYRLLAENVEDVIYTTDLDLNIKYASPAVVKLLGYNPEEILSMRLDSLVVPSSLPDGMKVAAERLAGPTGYAGKRTVEIELVRKDGGTVWVEASANFLQGQDGQAIGLIGVVRDIAERKMAQDALRASEANYRALFDRSLTGLEVVDAETMKVVLANESMAEMFGFKSPQDMVGTEPLAYVLPEDLDWVVRELSKATADPNMREVASLRARTEDGRVIWVAGMGRPFEYLGRPSILLSLVEVTATREAELKVAESEEKNRLLVDNAAEGIIVIQDGVLKFANRACTELSGYTTHELLGRSFLDVVHPDDRQMIAENHVKRLSGQEAANNYRFRIIHRAGKIKRVQINTVRFSWEGKPAALSMLSDVTSRVEAEEAFHESESRYRLLAENVSDVIWSVDLRSKRSFFSPSVTRLLGYTVDEAQAMRMKEVVSPASYSRATMALSQMMSGGEASDGSDGRSSSAQLELELIRKDGAFIWVDISFTVLRDRAGRPSEVFGVIRDVTQRKRAEEALKASEEYFRALIENAWDAIAIVNASGTMLYQSPSSARILGYEADEIVGENLARFVRPEDIAGMVEMFRRFRTEPGATVMVAAGFRHKDGHYIECEGTLQNLLHDPKINGIVANYRDVTDRRRAEEAIRTSEERFRNLVEATSDWVWEVDPNGVYTYVSPKVREVMGYQVGEIIGRSIFDFMPARESDRFSKLFQAHAAERRSFSFVESSRLHKDGRVLIMETSGVPFFGGDGALLGYRGIGRDITNRKKVEKQLGASLKKVEKTMEAAIQAISYTMETRDPYTAGHQKRVTQLACAIAKEMGVPPWQIDGIRVAGLLHDIGKIAVPTEILSKPGRLSDIEFSMIKAHPKVGFDILKNVEFEWPIARIVVQHHERLDGSGYPAGIRGKDILQEARILAVADVVEAMSSHRPYRPALGIDKALAEVAQGNGTLYDPDVVRACTVVINERGFKFEG